MYTKYMSAIKHVLISRNKSLKKPQKYAFVSSFNFWSNWQTYSSALCRHLQILHFIQLDLISKIYAKSILIVRNVHAALIRIKQLRCHEWELQSCLRHANMRLHISRGSKEISHRVFCLAAIVPFEAKNASPFKKRFLIAFHTSRQIFPQKAKFDFNG